MRGRVPRQVPTMDGEAAREVERVVQPPEVRRSPTPYSVVNPETTPRCMGVSAGAFDAVVPIRT